MSRNSVLGWIDGRGWLIFSGGEDSEIRAQALARASADGGVAYVTMGGDSSFGERALAEMTDLGAPSGYLVDVLSEDDETVQKKLSDAGMIVIESASNVADLRSALMGAAVEGMKAAYENGALILVEGFSAAVFGSWVVLESGNIVAGLEWLESALIVPGVTAVSESDLARAVWQTRPSAVAIGFGRGSALALGPDGELELWGKKQVTVALGPSYLS